MDREYCEGAESGRLASLSSLKYHLLNCLVLAGRALCDDRRVRRCSRQQLSDPSLLSFVSWSIPSRPGRYLNFYRSKQLWISVFLSLLQIMAVSFCEPTLAKT
jgi:hypothetical protein